MVLIPTSYNAVSKLEKTIVNVILLTTVVGKEYSYIHHNTIWFIKLS